MDGGVKAYSLGIGFFCLPGMNAPALSEV